jgi:crotonobetainyl-CoA:carnitine CoA-transferase CaiB-like acyl-CoA transferase
VAVAVTGDQQWRATCELLERPELAALELSERRARSQELDSAIEDWTSQRSAAEAAERLVARGVAAHPVQNTVEAWNDPQLRHRGHFQQVPHSIMGETWVEGSRFRLSRTAPVVGSPPSLGEHNWDVLTEVLGYDEERAALLAAEGIFD